MGLATGDLKNGEAVIRTYIDATMGFDQLAVENFPHMFSHVKAVPPLVLRTGRLAGGAPARFARVSVSQRRRHGDIAEEEAIGYFLVGGRRIDPTPFDAE